MCWWTNTALTVLLNFSFLTYFQMIDAEMAVAGSGFFKQHLRLSVFFFMGFHALN